MRNRIGIDHPWPESIVDSTSASVSVSRARRTSSVPARKMLSTSSRVVTEISSAFLAASHSSRLVGDGVARSLIIFANLLA